MKKNISSAKNKQSQQKYKKPKVKQNENLNFLQKKDFDIITSSDDFSDDEIENEQNNPSPKLYNKPHLSSSNQHMQNVNQKKSNKQKRNRSRRSYNKSKKDFKSLVDNVNVSMLKNPTLFSFIHDEYQLRSIFRIDKNENVFVCSPPLSGKTTIAYYAISRSLSNKKHIIYTSALKAHLNQRYNDFMNFTNFHSDIGIQTDELQENEDASVLLAALEEIQKIQNSNIDWFKKVETIIFDDFNYIDNNNKNIFKNLINLLPKNIQIIILSEPISNKKSIANSIAEIRKKNVYLEVNTKIAVPIKHMIYHSGRMFTLANSEKKDPDGKNLVFYESKYNEASFYGKVSINEPNYWSFFLNKLKRLQYFPALIYTSNIQTCNELAQYCKNAHILEDSELRQMNSFCRDAMENLSKSIRSTYQVNVMFDLIKCGIAVYHKDIFPELLKIIDDLFANGHLKAVFLVKDDKVFINQPVRAVCFTSLYNHSFNIKPSEYVGIASKVGRRGIDKVGYSVICMDQTILPREKLYKTLACPQDLFEKPFNIELKIKNSNNNSATNKSNPGKSKKIALNQKKSNSSKKMKIKTSSSSDNNNDDDDDVDYDYNYYAEKQSKKTTKASERYKYDDESEYNEDDNDNENNHDDNDDIDNDDIDNDDIDNDDIDNDDIENDDIDNDENDNDENENNEDDNDDYDDNESDDDNENYDDDDF